MLHTFRKYNIKEKFSEKASKYINLCMFTYIVLMCVLVPSYVFYLSFIHILIIFNTFLDQNPSIVSVMLYNIIFMISVLPLYIIRCDGRIIQTDMSMIAGLITHTGHDIEPHKRFYYKYHFTSTLTPRMSIKHLLSFCMLCQCFNVQCRTYMDRHASDATVVPNITHSSCFIEY